jgi:hypothetical protein
MPAVRPRSARHVGSVEWAWGPAHSRLDTLYLSLDRSRKFFLLWFEWADDGYSESRVVAYMPREGATANTAALAMTSATYRGEEQEYRSENGPWEVYSPGLLSHEELMFIAFSIWPAERKDRPQEPSYEPAEIAAAGSSYSARALDELMLAEVVLKREAHRALSGGVLGIGGMFLTASEAIEACSGTLTDGGVLVPEKGDTATAARHAMEALTRLESRLPPSPDRFASVLKVLAELAGPK